MGEWVGVKDVGLGMSVSAGIGIWVSGWVGVKDAGLGMSVSAGIGMWVGEWVDG